MSRPATDNTDVDTRIQDHLSNTLSLRLEEFKHHIARPHSYRHSVFFCRSQLQDIWDDDSVQIVFGSLSEAQRVVVKERLLLFISFLILIDIPAPWLSSSGDRLFERHDRTSPRFTDEDGPRSREQLLELGITPQRANRWEEQYLFRPATIILDPDGWEIQKVDWPCPLPFERPRNAGKIHDEYGDATASELEVGMVGLYQIPPEYVSTKRAGTHWIPQSPAVVVVKSFRARQRVVDEVKNMEFLKQSLTRNASIAIHDAIIEQTQGDYTTYSIISPYATLGDLAQFLLDGTICDENNMKVKVYDMKTNFPDVTERGQGLGSALLEQCKQLAEALKFLHQGFHTKDQVFKVYCAHMDLKPANILIFAEPGGIVGKWKLSDFGISVLQSEPLSGRESQYLIRSVGDLHLKAMEKTIRTVPKQQPSTYQAPEVEHPISDNSRLGGRSIDIWSYGTIFTEVLAYASGGAACVKEFRLRRRLWTHASKYMWENDFFYTPEPEAGREPSCPPLCTLRHEVSVWLDQLHMAPPTPNQPCLRCWADCARHILEIDPEKRPKAKTLSQDWLPKLLEHSAEPGAPHLQFENPENPDLRRPSTASVGSIRRPSTISVPLHSPATSRQATRPSLSSISQLSTTPKWSLSGTSKGISLSVPSASVGHDIYKSKLVYLTKQDIEVFDLDVEITSAKLQQNVKIPLPFKDHQWKGIKVATPYAAVWGLFKNTPIVRVFDVSTEAPLRVDQRMVVELTGLSTHFNYSKRVAISRLGYVAVFKENNISVFDARNGDTSPCLSIHLPEQGTITKFVDIAFDDAGFRLFAWAHRNLRGLLSVYDLSKDSHREDPICQREFEKDFSGRNAQVIPFPAQTDCIVSVGQKLFFGCVDEDRRKHLLQKRVTRGAWTPQYTSEPTGGWDLVAACVFNSSLVTLQGKKSNVWARRKGQIAQQEIGPVETVDFRSQNILAELEKLPDKEDELNEAVKMSVILCSDTDAQVAVLVAHKKGKVEVVT